MKLTEEELQDPSIVRELAVKIIDILVEKNIVKDSQEFEAQDLTFTVLQQKLIG